MVEFKHGQKVLVNVLLPGTTEPRLYNGVVEERKENSDTYKVRVEGGPVMMLGAAHIRAE